MFSNHKLGFTYNTKVNSYIENYLREATLKISKKYENYTNNKNNKNNTNLEEKNIIKYDVTNRPLFYKYLFISLFISILPIQFFNKKIA
jgi:hypothetical protein